MTATQEAALAALAVLVAERSKIDAINAAIIEIYSEGASTVSRMTDATEVAVINLLDVVLGDCGWASYLLYECNRSPGAVHDANGMNWPIGTVDDLRNYLASLDSPPLDAS